MILLGNLKVMEMEKMSEVILTEENRSGGKFMFFHKCPKCGFMYIVYMANYCGGCGKNIIWKDKELSLIHI